MFILIGNKTLNMSIMVIFLIVIFSNKRTVHEHSTLFCMNMFSIILYNQRYNLSAYYTYAFDFQNLF